MTRRGKRVTNRGRAKGEGYEDSEGRKNAGDGLRTGYRADGNCGLCEGESIFPPPLDGYGEVSENRDAI